MVTDGDQTGGRPLADVVAAAVAGGARAVLLREKHLDGRQRGELAETLAAIVHRVAGLLIVGSDPSLPGDGVHLAAADPVPQPRPPLLGRSCHDRSDVERAAAEGCDYITLSPVFASASKPGYGPALTPAALGGLPLPAWALGGVDATNAAACRRAGAAGVAVMGAIMRAADPAATTAALLAVLAGAAA